MNALKTSLIKPSASLLIALASAIVVSACGGGGGSPGATGSAATTGGTTGGSTGTTGTGSTTTTPVATPAIKLALSSGGATTTSISASGVTTAQATVLDDKNQPVRGKLVTFSGDPALVSFSPPSGSVLTDATTGVATIQVSPASITAAGAGSLTASTTVIPTTGGAGVATTATLDYQLSAANLTLTALNVATATPLPAYGTRAVTVMANINGAAATTTPVQVTFTSSCGAVTPATATTDGTGKASATYTANSTTIPGCAGANVSITAATAGAASLGSTINVQPTQATNIQFVSAAPQLIYLIGSVGATQSQVSFKLVDSSGSALQNQAMTLSLTNTGTGVSLGTVGNKAAVTLTSDSNGVVSAPVFSGSIPTSIQVNAVLAANPAVNAKSNVLIVASGVPVQKAVSLSLEKLSIDGLNVDGTSTNVTFSMADRQGNPVPVGTSVNFVSSAGVMVPATCVVPARADGTSSSSCSVTIRSQGTRPSDGRVAILAYTPGEEDFVDNNANNVFDAGDTFTDLGNAFRDDNFNSTFDAGEFTVPRAGASTCAGGINGRLNTCDGVWGAVDVRDQKTIIFASSAAVITPVSTSLASGVAIGLADVNGNSMPTGTTISVAGRPALPAGACSASTTVAAVANSLTPIVIGITTDPKCAAGDFIDVKITSPLGLVTPLTFRLSA